MITGNCHDTQRNRKSGLRPLFQFLLDAMAWTISIPIATVLRFDVSDDISWETTWWTVLAVVVAQGVLGSGAGLYRRRWRYGGSEELLRTAMVVLGIGMTLGLLIRTEALTDLRKSVPSFGPMFAVILMVGSRQLWRRTMKRSRVTNSGELIPTLVVGAGDAGYSAVRLMLDDRRSIYRPIALVDDDPLKSNLRLYGVEVKGGVHDLVNVARETGAKAILMAIPSADVDLVRIVDDLAREADLPLMVLPPVTRLFSTLNLADIRPVSESDLLGRPTTEIDDDVLAHFIRGRRVLITGAGGSIGSELSRQLVRFEPSALIMLDRDESLLADVQLSLEGRALLDNPNLVLVDIRDAARVDQIFDEFRPDVVFHAAALKHLTFLERFPREAWMTNVQGTINVLEAARRVGVSNFVNISTDKAADPVSVLGSTKRITERLTAQVAVETGYSYVSVRFGNVLGSRGSVLNIFKQQAEIGGPLTVTDPGVTRFFMTVKEATKLTAFAGAIGRQGEVLVLDMGAPVRIADVARRFARQHSPELSVVYTGLRTGEKLHESLFADHEEDLRPVHPLVSHVPVAPLAFSDVRAMLFERDDALSLAQQFNVLATA